MAAGLVAAVVWIVQSRDDERPLPAGPAAASDAGSADADAADGATAADEDEPTDGGGPKVKVLTLGDGSVDQRSVRVLHPDVRAQQRLHDWLEPRETAAVATNGALECLADTATDKLVSVRCVSVPEDAAAEPVYEGLTLLVEEGDVKELKLADVLRPGVGQKQVVDACKKAADPPLPCAWPPTAFSVVQGASLFVCHGSTCVDLEADARLVRPDLGPAPRDD